MKYFQGKSVYKGVVMGPAVVVSKSDQQVPYKKIEDVHKEVARLQKAIDCSRQQLQSLYDKAIAEIGKAGAAIFEVHQMMLEDKSFLTSATQMIEAEQVNAEYAVWMVSNQYVQKFSAMDDELMQARAADIKDVSKRLIVNLDGNEKTAHGITVPSIIFADDLSPSETMQMEKEKILAFVTVRGSVNSHTAVLARMMNVPALVGVSLKLEEITNGTIAAVDGFRGEVILEPDEETGERINLEITRYAERLKLLQELKGKENITLDGRKIKISANIGSVEDIKAVWENDACGIGLFRSEFLYLGRSDFPTEEEQYKAYKQVAEDMKGQKVIIRTLDIGVDKQVDYFHLGKEENPALGYRGIRICLKEPEVFKVQLRALLRAAACGNLAVMYPMITSVEEVEQIKEILEEVKKELKEAGIPYRIPAQGVMIETPAAVMISDELAEAVDFFSIGTNDLAQYTLAVDRQNEKLDDFYNPYHKALLRMIKMVVDNAHKHGKCVGICGELGADTAMTETFMRMGVDELSVAPSMVLPLRKIIREMVCEDSKCILEESV